MKRTVTGCYFVLLSLLSAGTGSADPVIFNRDIRPILADRCFHCHGPAEKNREAHLRLDRPDGGDGALRTHEGATAIKPGDLKASRLWYRI
ncbi:MAG: c-type cytochrome domain-containing protein, partial [Pirellulales bacterium]